MGKRNSDGTVTLKTKGTIGGLKGKGGGGQVEPSTPPSSNKQVGIKGRTVVGKSGTIRP